MANESAQNGTRKTQGYGSVRYGVKFGHPTVNKKDLNSRISNIRTEQLTPLLNKLENFILKSKVSSFTIQNGMWDDACIII